jgi:5'(3')-deoxyribonucleotidase
MPHISELDWSTHTHIGLDLDETLAATMSGMLAYAHSIGELSHLSSLEQIKSHDASGLGSHITTEEAISLWEGYGKSTPTPQSVDPIEGSIEWVRLLRERGKDISIVTARSDQESWKVDRTHRWIRSHFAFLDESDIHFVNHFSQDARPKSVVCAEKGISLMVDDALENAYELCKNGIVCILLEKPWNRKDFEHPLLYRARDWQEIINSLT